MFLVLSELWQIKGKADDHRAMASSLAFMSIELESRNNNDQGNGRDNSLRAPIVNGSNPPQMSVFT